MYPAHFLALFPPFPRKEEVFVAMSFDTRFNARWSTVIDPAIRSILVNGRPLQPCRVDTRSVSDSILTEILSGISASRLILADITTIGVLEGRPIRSGNVMYELGIAQAVRLPEEVLIFRSDADDLLFDTSNIRVNLYDPDVNPDNARAKVAECVLTALRELDLRKHLDVSKAADSIDHPSWWLLTECNLNDEVAHPQQRTMGQVLGNAARAAAIARLLEIGAIRTRYLSLTPELLAAADELSTMDMMKYECTEFGRAVFREVAGRLGLERPEIQAAVKQAGTVPGTS